MSPVLNINMLIYKKGFIRDLFAPQIYPLDQMT